MAQLIVTISLAANPHDPRTSHAGGKFNAECDGHVLARPSRTPFLAMARTLLEAGYDPAIVIVMRHKGSNTDCLTSVIGEAAKLAVQETRFSAPIFTTYKPFSMDPSG